MPILKKTSECNAVVTSRDGQTVEISATDLWDLGLAHWAGWKCAAGRDMIFVDHDFTVYSGHCRNDCLGSIFDPEFRLFAGYTTCHRAQCTPCASDLYADKHDPTVDR